ncbi:DUF2199 domain-containing protein [Paenibacillus sp. YYML68]|uniref:DUF2199 domain-containing protein n=1 Tax=Paenibacillus sp. YYML68 TaxID=2909250 RepID=UPI00249391B9|nr:DUF2199 domain-containing protein [Paenibacillus sp. YYML68]
MRCPHCNEKLKEIPLCYGSNAPYVFYTIDKKERELRFDLNKDQCVMDDKFFFIRGHIEIPVLESDDIFIWSAWVSLSEENFIKSTELWNSEERIKEPPYFGWLSTEISIYSTPTLNLKTNVHTRKVGLVPFIELEPNDHPLAIEQRTGITMKRIQEITHLIMHKK